MLENSKTFPIFLTHPHPLVISLILFSLPLHYKFYIFTFYILH